LISATTSINAVWVYGPYDPSPVSAGSQPDWYMLWTDGGLRLIPGWESTIFGYVLSWNMLIPFAEYGPLLASPPRYPFLEPGLPYSAPGRTGLGVAWIMVYLILALAATNDLIAIALDLSINDLTWAFRIGIFVAPVLAFFITKRLCLSIQRQKRQKALHGEET